MIKTKRQKRERRSVQNARLNRYNRWLRQPILAIPPSPNTVEFWLGYLLVKIKKEIPLNEFQKAEVSYFYDDQNKIHNYVATIRQQKHYRKGPMQREVELQFRGAIGYSRSGVTVEGWEKRYCIPISDYMIKMYGDEDVLPREFKKLVDNFK